MSAGEGLSAGLRRRGSHGLSSGFDLKSEISRPVTHPPGGRRPQPLAPPGTPPEPPCLQSRPHALTSWRRAGVAIAFQRDAGALGPHSRWWEDVLFAVGFPFPGLTRLPMAAGHLPPRGRASQGSRRLQQRAVFPAIHRIKTCSRHKPSDGVCAQQCVCACARGKRVHASVHMCARVLVCARVYTREFVHICTWTSPWTCSAEDSSQLPPVLVSVS